MKIFEQDAKELIDLVARFKSEKMIAGDDYGIIPGAKSENLLKGGAEKLMKLFGLTAHLEKTHDHVDYTTGFRHVAFGCTLKQGNSFAGHGFGESNTNEKGFGQDKFGAWNSVTKKAKKRAVNDAVLTTCCASTIFTTDLDDMTPDELASLKIGGRSSEQCPRPSAPVGASPAASYGLSTFTNRSGFASDKQVGLIVFLLGKAKGLPGSEPFSSMNKEMAAALTVSQASSMIGELKAIVEAAPIELDDPYEDDGPDMGDGPDWDQGCRDRR